MWKKEIENKDGERTSWSSTSNVRDKTRSC